MNPLDFREYRAKKTVNTIPYSSNLNQAPPEQVPIGNFNSKKVTVVGMGQVSTFIDTSIDTAQNEHAKGDGLPTLFRSLLRSRTCLFVRQVGLGCVTAILNQDICGTIAMIDIATQKLAGEAKDFQQGGGFHQTTTILASDKYDVSANSDLVVITAGVAQKPGESRLSLVERNAKIMKMIMPEVLKYSPNATILIVSNPCDIMTAIAAKIAGPNYPQGKIFGAGTNLDSSRFQMLMASSMDLVRTHGNEFRTSPNYLGFHTALFIPRFCQLTVHFHIF
jgi:lactate/malate dehydrogenase, NAD binding domain